MYTCWQPTMRYLQIYIYISHLTPPTQKVSSLGLYLDNSILWFFMPFSNSSDANTKKQQFYSGLLACDHTAKMLLPLFQQAEENATCYLSRGNKEMKQRFGQKQLGCLDRHPHPSQRISLHNQISSHVQNLESMLLNLCLDGRCCNNSLNVVGFLIQRKSYMLSHTGSFTKSTPVVQLSLYLVYDSR